MENAWHKNQLVYIASPLRGNIRINLANAAQYCEAAVHADVIPLAPHLYFSTFLDDLKPADRMKGMAMGIRLLSRCDALWVFGEPTEGVRAEILFAETHHIPIMYFQPEVCERIIAGDLTAISRELCAKTEKH